MPEQGWTTTYGTLAPAASDGWVTTYGSLPSAAPAASPEPQRGYMDVISDLLGSLTNPGGALPAFLGVGRGAANDLARTFTGLGGMIRGGASAVTGGAIPAESEAFDVARQALSPQTPDEGLGALLSTLAQFALPTGVGTGAVRAAGGLVSGGASGARLGGLAGLLTRGAAEGATSGGIAAARGEDPGLAALLGAVSPVLSAGVAAGVPRLAPMLRESAERQYARVLNPTRQAAGFKEATERVVPELLERRVTALSRQGLENKAAGRAAAEGTRLDDALASVPKGTQTGKAKIVAELEDLKAQYTAPGANGQPVVAHEAAVRNLTELQDLVTKTDASFESMRRLRQILDNKVTAGKKQFGRTVTEGTELDATREASNAIRRELASTRPDVAAINKEFSFWKRVEEIQEQTNERMVGQAKPLGQQLWDAGVGAGGLAGIVSGGGLGTVAAAAAGMKLVRDATQTAAWRTFSAVQKARVADALARGDVEGLRQLLTPALQTAVSAASGRQTSQTQRP